MRPALLALALLGGSVLPARAELVFFASGRAMSVRGHQIDGDVLVLMLRGGGELVCDASLITRIAPDEVPYPEPEPALEPAAVPGPISVIAGVHSPLPTDARYDPIIRKVAAEQGVNAELVRAVIQVESAYQHRARSLKGAVGLMQLMPATARQYGVLNSYDPAANIEAGIKHLKALLERFPLSLALAAYNAGQGAVERFGGIPPFPETQRYVSRVLALVGG
jgi:soluble lytic murein transglycosylase-like protein